MSERFIHGNTQRNQWYKRLWRKLRGKPMNKIENILDNYLGDEISWVSKKVRAHAWKSILCAFALGFFVAWVF